MANLEKFTEALRGLDEPDALASLAATALAHAGSNDNPAPWLFVSMLLMRLATAVDGEPLSEEDWIAMRSALHAIADSLEQPNLQALNKAAFAYLDWRRPSAMH